MLKWLANYLIARAERTPHLHLKNTDGSFYMRRFWLRKENKAQDNITVRVHHIADIDRDVAMHDHPWDFISIVLRGGYIEMRPVRADPCFLSQPVGAEDFTYNFRNAGSIAYRHATDRHRIIDVRPDTWTLFITFKKVQWWGFYTLRGKIYYKDYQSEHDTRGVR